MSNQIIKTKPENSIYKALFSLAAKDDNPDEKLNDLRNKLCDELIISRKMLTHLENNSSQPSFEQLVQTANFLKQYDSAITVNSLIK